MTDILRDPAKVLCDIIQAELELTNEQVLVYNQKFNIPTQPGLYVVVRYVSGRAYGGGSIITGTEGVTAMTETQQLLMNAIYQIDLMSADESARMRKEEVLMALQSLFAQQQCELYQMNIARLPQNFIDASDIEGTARLTRFTATIVVNSIYEKTKSAPFFDTFQEPEMRVN